MIHFSYILHPILGISINPRLYAAMGITTCQEKEPTMAPPETDPGRLEQGWSSDTELTYPEKTHSFKDDKSVRSCETIVAVPSMSSRSSSPCRSKREPELPDKKGCRAYRFLRWNGGSVYRRIFTAAFLGNVAAIAVLLVENALHGSGLTYGGASTAVACNLLAAMVVRNEHIVNGLFTVFAIWPSKRLPLMIRRWLAKVYCYGGIHSGCSVAATFWYIAFLGLITRDYLSSELSVIRSHILLVSYLILFLLVTILIFAYPAVRVATHNWFEGIHRFMGWSAVLLFWVQTFLAAAETSQNTHIPYWQALLKAPVFWMLFCITALIIYPWTRLRLRPVEVEPLSTHCVKLNFAYTTGHYGQAIRLADAPLKETHAFAIIPNTTTEQEAQRSSPQTLTKIGTRGFSVIVSDAGDWTRRMISQPPRQLWTRGVPQSGFLRVAGLFAPVLVVATGSGIAPCLALFVDRPGWAVRVVWAAKDPARTYGRAVLDTVYGADPEAVVIDTGREGRPDLVRLAYRVWKNSGGGLEGGKSSSTKGRCEAVMVISNQPVTRKVVYGLESRGVPAYGAIFDS